MNPVKEETLPVVNETADQKLVKETGGAHGGDNSGHADVTREGIARDLGEKSAEAVTPETELAEKGLEETGKAGFLKDVVGVQEEIVPNQSETLDPPLDLNKFGEHLNAFSPIGEENDRGMPSAKANEVELKRQEQMKAK